MSRLLIKWLPNPKTTRFFHGLELYRGAEIRWRWEKLGSFVLEWVLVVMSVFNAFFSLVFFAGLSFALPSCGRKRHKFSTGDFFRNFHTLRRFFGKTI